MEARESRRKKISSGRELFARPRCLTNWLGEEKLSRPVEHLGSVAK
ncbi:hypothetical protein SEF58_00530 [Neomoorella humiferrea]